MKFADKFAISLAYTRNIGLREKMRRIFSVYNNEANAPPLSSPSLPPYVRSRALALYPTWLWFEIIKGLVFFEAFAN